MEKNDWILDPSNIGVVEILKLYLPNILNGQYGIEYKFEYENGVIIDYTTAKISSSNIDLNPKYIQIN